MKALILLPFLLVTTVLGDPVRITIERAPSHDVPKTLNGIFFEDINYGADGGLYAELIQNRSFEHEDALAAWSQAGRGGMGTIQISEEKPFHSKNPHFLRLEVSDPGHGFGVANEGWDGIALNGGETYPFSILVRHVSGRGKLLVRLVAEDGSSLAESILSGIGSDWKRLQGVLKPSRSADRAKFEVLALVPGVTDIDMVSLFPAKTWNNRPNGLRSDLVKALKDLKPGFVRFPGGCIVEGQNMGNAYRWKETIGDIATRPEKKNRWMDSFQVKAPQYYQTYGLGFYEYFLLCEDLGAEPLPILNCGMSCQFEKGCQVVCGKELDPYIQDALDLIEFANGAASSTWGAKRAAMGHPEPFHLKFLGIGNEQWGPEYLERYKAFYEKLKGLHPGIQFVMATGPGVGDAKWKFLMDQIRNGLPADMIDEHYYRSPGWFLANAGMYDHYDRKGPKVFAGEYAAHLPKRDGDVLEAKSQLRAAIAEAVMLTGFLRNSDVVVMSSYAPLFARKDHTQWTPDLIYFDNRRVCLTPSYHVQALFSRNRPDAVLPMTLTGNDLPSDPATKSAAKSRLHAVAGLDRVTGQTLLFVVNPGRQSEKATIVPATGSFAKGEAVCTVLSGDPESINTLENQEVVKPVTTRIPIEETISINFPPDSVTLLRMP